MTNLFTNLSKNGSEPVNGSRMDRHYIENGPIHSRQLFALLFCLLFVGVGNAWGTVQSGWTRVTSTSEILAGGTFIIGYESTANSDVIIPMRSDGANATTSAQGYLYSGTTKDATTTGTIDMSSIANTSPYEFTIAESSVTDDAITIQMSTGNYIGTPPAKNTAKLYASANSTCTDYTVEIGSNDVVTLTNVAGAATQVTDGKNKYYFKYLRYNTGSGSQRFAHYRTGQADVVMYKKSAGCTNGTITYSAGSTTHTGGNAISGSHANDTKVCSTNLTLPGATFTTTGYTQDGWATSDGGSKVYNLGATNYSTEGNATLYPHWTVNNYTVTWMSNGSQHTTTSVAYGSKPTFPSNPSSCDATSTTFYGWSTAEWTGALDDVSAKTIYTDASAMPAVTGAVTYYAVFAKAVKSDNFQLLTSSSNFISGEDYLIESYFSSTDHVLKAANYSGYSYQQTSENSWTLPSSGVNFDMSSKSDLCIWKITSEGNNQFSIYNASANKYLVLVKVSTYDNLILSATKDASFIRTVVKEDGYSDVFKFESSAISGKHLYCAGSYWYAYTSAEEVYLYKRVTTYSKYLTNCCTNLGSINGSVSWSNDGTSLTVKNWGYTPANTGDESHISKYTVYLYSDADSYAASIDNEDCTVANRASTGVTFTGLNYARTYKVKITATPASGYCPVDDVWSSTTYKLTCATPTAATAGSFDRTTQKMPISWTSGAGKVDICYSSNSSTPAATPGSGYTVVSDQTSSPVNLDVSGLAAGNYYCWVRSVCDASNKSSWTAITGSTFTIPAHTLTITKDGGGTSTITPASGSSVVEGRTASITASPATGYAFDHWAVSGTNATLSSTSTNPTTFTMGTANATVTGYFTCVEPVIGTDPADANYYIGDSPEALEVEATLASGTLTYLWKVSTNGGSTWSDATGTNNAATYSGASLSTASVGTLKFKCIVGNSEGGCTVESEEATITVANASYFPNGVTVFIQADSKDYSAWKDDACVKAWFNASGAGGAAQTTYWLFDATDTDAGKKLFAAIVPSTGDLNQVTLQRFQSDCLEEHWYNNNGTLTQASSSGVNTFRSYGSADNNIAWNGSSTTLSLYGNQNSWASSLATFADQGSGVWTATISNYAPDATSKDYKIKTSYNNGWIGNTGSNNNATLSGMIVGSTYNVTATLDVTDHSLVMSKEFVKGTVHFDLQGHGIAISDLENVAAGSKISAPSAPSATGYTFGGWYKEPACTNAWTFASDVVNETMTLYAKWTANVYTITKTFSNVTNASLPASFTYTGSTTTALNSTFAVDATNFFLPSSIAVTMGGTPLTAGTDYTYNNSTGAFTFSAVITGDIVITASATAKLKSIAITTQPTTRKYLVGDLFSSTGAVVTATMGDGNTKAVSATWTPSSALSAGTGQTVTASYTENGINMTATTTVDVYSVTVSKVNMSGTAISVAGVTASCSGRTLSQSVGSTNYKFNSWEVTAGGVTISTNTITGTPTGNVTINAKFHDPISVTWKVGTAAASGSPTTEVKYGTKISALPSTPADNAIASCGANKFMGWTAAGKIEGTGHSAPADLFTTVGGATTLTENTIYRAVFATQSSGGAAVNTVLWAEDFSGWGDGDVPNSDAITNSHTGTTVYGSATLTYACVNGDSNTKLYGGKNTLYAGGSAPELLVGKNTGSFTVSGIPNGGASEVTVSYKQNDKELTVAASGTGYSGSANNTPAAATTESFDVTVGSASTFTLTFTPNTSNVRIDDISVKVKTVGTTISDYITGCCTPLDDLNGEVTWSNATTAVVSWDDIAHVDSWTVKYKTHAAGAWNTAGASSASAGTRSVTISSLTPCTDYDFQIIATPEEDYCDKNQTIEDDQTHAYSVDYSGCSNVTKTAGGTTACGSSNLVATFTASLPYELPSSVSVSIGNVAQTQGTDFTWVVSEGVGTLTIGSAKQTGNIVIDVDGNLLTCDVNPTIGTATLDGSGTFNLSSVAVSVTGCSVEGVVCEWTDYGFVWGTSANPTGNKTAIGSDGTATSWSGTLTGSFSTGVTYYYRAYGKNSKDGAEIIYGSDASFIPRSVTFNANGGSDVATKYVASGGTVSAPSAPTKSGYNFGGWYTDNGTWKSAVDWSSTISANVTYYAKWNTVPYTITYEGLSGASNSNPEEYTIETPTITLVNPGTRTGWTFAGWTCGGEPITQIVVGSTGNKTITATWTINQYNIAVAEVDGVTITATPTGGSTLAEGANTDVDYNKTVTLAKEGLGTGIYWVGWKVTNAGGDDVTASVVSENTLTVPAYDVTVTAVLGKMKAWCMPEFEITGDVHLTSVKDVYVNSTSTTGDLLTVSGTNTENVTRISIDYLDNNGDVVGTKSSSPLRLRAGDNSGYVESDITTGFSTGTYSGSFSVRFTPTAYGELDNYKLRLTIKKGSRVLKTIEHPMSGRALPEEFVIAVKQNDQWYALPNTILDNNRAITPLKITVNDATTPTAATYAPSTAVYKGYETGNSRYAAGTNVYGVRLTDPNNKWLQVSSSPGTNYVWVSGTGNATCQDWWLSSSDFHSYTLKVPSSGAGDKSFGINNLGNIGYFASDATNLCKEVFLLPITNKYTDIAATATEWGQHSVVLAANPGATADKAQARIDDGSPTADQTITAINAAIGTAKNVKVPLGDIDLDVSEGNEGKLLYIDWYNGSTLLGTSCVTIPRIVAEDRTANKTNDTDKKVWNTEVHVLPGATLTIDGESFKTGVINSTVSVNELQVYPGATINVSTGTLAASTLRLRNGWTRAGEKKYDVARVYIADDAALTKGTASMDYNIYELADGQHFYPLAVPFPVAVSAIDYADSWLAGFSRYGMDGQYVIKEYNGARRAEKGPDQANNWTPLAEGATLSPGKGYIMAAVPVYGEAIIRVPLTFDNGWTSDGEKASYDDVTKNVVPVEAYAKAEGETKNANKGWNLLGVPFMSCYTTSAGMYAGDGAATIIQGKFDFDDGTWDDDKVRYVSVPVHDFSEYIQTDITDDDTKLLPGWSFFVQIETSGNLTFLTAQQAEDSDLPIYAPKRGVKADMPTVKTGIILSGEEASDKTTFLVSDKYNGAEYEINADLEKMFGNGYTLATYSLSGATRLAYNAMSNADASNIIPIGYRAPAEGEYTFSINPRYAQNSAFESVNLIDYETGIVTDLLQYSYTFSTGRTQNDSRFAINVVKQKETPTDIENIQGDNVQGTNVRKLLIDGKVYIIRGGQMYDATGKKVREINK